MNSRRLKFSTAVDWLEIEIQTSTPTNFMTVQKALASLQGLPESATPYVEPLDAGAGGAASTFRFKLQDPKNYQAIMALLAQFGKEFALQCPPTVTGIEVAFDTFCTGADARQLAEIVADRHCWSTYQPGRDWHLYRKAGEGRIYLNTITRRELTQHLANGWQLTDAATKDAGIRIHAYVKTTDAGLGLEPHKRRARFEVTLRGHALPCTTLDRLEHFDFTGLVDYFQFRQYADNNPCKAIAHARGWSGITQPGRRGPYRRRHKTDIGRYSGTREFKSWTVSDGLLNAQVYAQLRKLTRSWRGKRE